MSNSTTSFLPEVQRLQVPALVVGCIGLALCGIGAIFDPEQFFHSYLLAFVSWLDIALGCLGMWMIHFLTGGQWGLAIRRILEAGTRTLPLLAILFLPLLLGLASIYPWVDPSESLLRELGSKLDYLNVRFFIIRAAIYFAIWIGTSWLLGRWSTLHDRTGDPIYVLRSEQLSGPGLVVGGLAVTFAGVDWIMSLEPKWFSTIFGALISMGQLLPALALAIAVAAWLAPHTSIKEITTPPVWNDLGSLLFAFVMLWTYMAFSQFLLIWSGNLPEEIIWYVARSSGGWEYIAVLLAVFYFALPLMILLSRNVKRYPRRLMLVALLIVAMNFVNNYWLISPAFSPQHIYLHWMDLAALVGVGGWWSALFLYQLQARPLLPVHNPLPQEALSHA